MERANLFLTPLDPMREWFRYQGLFADLLQRRLTETEGAAAAAELHLRAARWYHKAGEPVEAVHHALARATGLPPRRSWLFGERNSLKPAQPETSSTLVIAAQGD